MMILLIEDDPADALLIKIYLEKAQASAFQLDNADRLSTGISKLSQGSYQAVLLDLSLPDSHGLDTFIRLQPYTPHTPVLILTGHDDQELAFIAVREGAQDYLIKGQISGAILERALRYAVERQRLMENLLTNALTDQLTGLYNRRAFLTLAERQIRIAHRAGRELLLLFLDLDRFKEINDTFGHHTGDLALQDIAEVLRQTYRESDIVARLGGDEFVILAIEATVEALAPMIVRLQNNLLAYEAGESRPYQLSFSIGYAIYQPSRPCSIAELMKQADANMYQQKRNKSTLPASRLPSS